MSRMMRLTTEKPPEENRPLNLQDGVVNADAVTLDGTWTKEENSNLRCAFAMRQWKQIDYMEYCMTNIKIGTISIAAIIGALALLVNALNKGPSPLDTAMAAIVVLLGLVFVVWALAQIAHRKDPQQGARRKRKPGDGE
jgi:hypothetical protein